MEDKKMKLFDKASFFVALLFFLSACTHSEIETNQNSGHNTENLTGNQGVPLKLSAEESDPEMFQWMYGFPPPKEKRLSAADGTFFRFPALRWSVVHMREFMPTINVSRGLGNASELNYDLDPQIDLVEFQPWDSDQMMTWKESLQKSYADGILIMHRGKVVYEKYFGALTKTDVHAVMSVSKIFTGTLASILVAEGVLNEKTLIKEYIPELSGSAFGDATLRQLMDMTTSLQYSEDYSDPNAEIWAFSAAGNPLPKPAEYQGPVGYYEYLQTIRKEGEHGEVFGYKTVNTDALGWVI